jgi:hypothetical protein
LVIKKNEILLFAAKWMELGDIFLNEISRHRKPNTTCSLSSVEATKSRYAHRKTNITCSLSYMEAKKKST